MVKHIILWQLKDELTTEQKAEVKAGIKAGLEGLKDKIEGLTDVHVNIDCLPSSNADVMLDTTFTDTEALKNYAVHPEHVKVADGKSDPIPRFVSAWIMKSSITKGSSPNGKLPF